MALKILKELCTVCTACDTECPNGAISFKKGSYSYAIDADKCTECEGNFDEPQCVGVCPVDDCIVAA